MPPEPAEVGVTVPDALELLAYLVTAADLCTREPYHYGMFRLLDAAARLARGLEAGGATFERPWISELRQRIDANKELLMWDQPAFEQFLHKTAGTVAAELTADRVGRV